MKTTKPIAGAVLSALILTSLGLVVYKAVGESPVVASENQTQTKADESALARERAQLRSDQTTLGADSRSGRLAAESPDEQKVYEDRQAIKGEKADIARDEPGSLQQRSDRAALQREQTKLKADANTWAADTRAGRMAAESADAESVYRDQQAIKGQENALAADRATSNTDRKN